MFHLSNYRGQKFRHHRGEKQRYSVNKAESNIREEKLCEKFCKEWCEKFGEDIKKYYIEHPKFPWSMTREYIAIILRQWPYSKPEYVLRRFSEKRLKEIDENIETARKIQQERMSNET